MSRNWTKAQKDAIDARNGSVLVSAAAGSGKTAVLTERVIERLTDRENPTDADRLLIVTFTRAAAAEMRERISVALSELIKNNPGDSNLLKQQMLLPGAKISTMDSFCMSLVKENFQLLDIAPDFKMGEESEVEIIKNAAMDEAIELMYSEGEESFKTLVEVLFKGRDDTNIENAMNKLYSNAVAYPFPETRIDEFYKCFDNLEGVKGSLYGEIIYAYLKSELVHIAEVSAEILRLIEGDESLTKVFYKAVSSDKAQAEYILDRLLNSSFDEMRGAALRYSPERKGRCPSDIKEDPSNILFSSMRDDNKDRFKKIKEILVSSEEEFLEDMRFFAPLMKSLCNCTKKFMALFEEKKREKKLCDFNDIMHLSLSLLVRETENGWESTEFAKETAKSFDEILIDEYQDTNKAQDMLFTSISRNNLFRVGDVKQSIYSFRQAMPEIFLSLKEEYELYEREKDNYPSKIVLGNNFRSRKGVTDIINFIFSSIMSKESGDIEYTGEEQLVASAAYEKKGEPESELHILDTSGLNIYTENENICQAKYIAELIKKMISEGYAVKEGSGERRASYKDFAILLRAAGNKGVTYADVLRRAGIPTFTEVSGEFLNSTEISLAVNILRVIDNPKQDVPLISVLLSPIFGFSVDEVSDLRSENRKGDIYSCLLKAQEKGNERVIKLLKRISYWRSLSLCLSVGELLNEIYEETAIVSVFDAADKSGTKRANLMLLCDYAVAYEKSGYSGLTGFLSFIDKLKNKNNDLSGSLGISENADVVKIMTIHKSKGLEFPVCILSDCAKQFNKEDLKDNLVISKKDGVGIKRRDVKSFLQYDTLCNEAIKLSLKKEIISEEMRVLYVALTRAKEKLIMLYADKEPLKKCRNYLSVINPNKACLSSAAVRNIDSYGGWIIASILRHEGAKNLREELSASEGIVLPCSSGLKVVLSAYENEVGFEERRAAPARADERFLSLLKERADFKYKYEPLSKVITKRAASEVDKKSIDRDYFASAVPSFMLEDGLNGAMRGIATHTFIQFADYERAKESVENEIQRLFEKGLLTETQIKGINIPAVQRFFESELFKRIEKSPLLMREKKFTIEVPVNEIYPEVGELGEELMMIQGIADCAFLENGELVVVDYKTDALKTEEEFREKYKNQVLLYKKALSLSTGYRVKETFLYAFNLGKEIKVI